LLREAVDAPSLEVFKATWSSGRCPCPQQGVGTTMIYKVPSNPNRSVIPILLCKVSFMTG